MSDSDTPDTPGEETPAETSAVDIDVNVEIPETESEEIPGPEPIVIETETAASNIDSEIVAQLIGIREAITLQGVAIAELQNHVIRLDAETAEAGQVAESANRVTAEMAEEIEEVKEGQQAPPEEDTKPERKDWQSRFLGF